MFLNGVARRYPFDTLYMLLLAYTRRKSLVQVEQQHLESYNASEHPGVLCSRA